MRAPPSRSLKIANRARPRACASRIRLAERCARPAVQSAVPYDVLLREPRREPDNATGVAATVARGSDYERAARKSAKTKRHRLFSKNLLKLWPALWTFTAVDGVEPTNNHAERGLRGAVIYRKLALGSQSDHGERTIERLPSASVTCRLQGRSLFAYLTDVLSARIRGDPVPVLA